LPSLNDGKIKLNNCVFTVLCPLKPSVQNEIVTLQTATKQEDADKSASTLIFVKNTDPSLNEDVLFCDLHLFAMRLFDMKV